MLAREDLDELLKRQGNVLSADGEKIGAIGQAYADDADGLPSWVTAKTGLFGMSESFVPLEGARIDGDDLVVPYRKNQVKDAPRIDAEGHLEPSGEDRLYRHYQLGGEPRTYTEALAGGYDDAGGTVGGNAPGPGVEDAVTRSGERLGADTGRQPGSRPRLRRYIAAGAPGRGEHHGADGTDDTRR